MNQTIYAGSHWNDFTINCLAYEYVKIKEK